MNINPTNFRKRPNKLTFRPLSKVEKDALRQSNIFMNIKSRRRRLSKSISGANIKNWFDGIESKFIYTKGFQPRVNLSKLLNRKPRRSLQNQKPVNMMSTSFNLKRKMSSRVWKRNDYVHKNKQANRASTSLEVDPSRDVEIIVKVEIRQKAPKGLPKAPTKKMNIWRNRKTSNVFKIGKGGKRRAAVGKKRIVHMRKRSLGSLLGTLDQISEKWEISKKVPKRNDLWRKSSWNRSF